MSERTVIYTRVSDPKDPEQTSTAQQEAKCRAHAKSKGWAISGVYEDAGKSAWKKNAKRPKMDEMISAIEAGPVHRVLAWKVDRLNRQPRDLERLLDALEPRGGSVATVVEGEFVGDQGLFTLRLLTLLANNESNNTSLRVRNAMDQLAEQGRSHGGPRMYGLTKSRDALVPEEADLIREAVARVLEGEAPMRVVKDWEQRGVKTAAGSAWSSVTLSRILRNPSIAGLRVHQGEVIGRASWPPIISEEEHRALMVRLDPAKTARGNDRPRRYVLTGGLVRCGLCGRPLMGKQATPAYPSRRYVCKKEPGTPGCGRITIQAEGLEEYVRELAFAFVASPDFDRLLAERAKEDTETAVLLDAAKTDRHRLEMVEHAHFVEGTVSKGSYVKLARELTERIQRNERALQRAAGARSVAVVPNGEEALRAAWATRGIEWQANFLRAVIDRVVVNPGVSGRRPFDASRVDVVWHE